MSVETLRVQIEQCYARGLSPEQACERLGCSYKAAVGVWEAMEKDAAEDGPITIPLALSPAMRRTRLLAQLDHERDVVAAAAIAARERVAAERYANTGLSGRRVYNAAWMRLYRARRRSGASGAGAVA